MNMQKRTSISFDSVNNSSNNSSHDVKNHSKTIPSFTEMNLGNNVFNGTIEHSIKVLKANPLYLFSNISQERVILWQELLHIDNNDDDYIKFDDDIFFTELNHKNQSTIHADCIRTRVKESCLIPSFISIIEHLITFYCNNKGINYKQGLNEIFSPFLLLKSSMQISFTQIYNLSSVFIDHFLTNYYRENTLYSLRSSMSLVVLLLKYHLPSIYDIFDKNMIRPEMYCMSWLMTVFASKFQLDSLYHLWDHLIRINDPIFIHFIIIALFKFAKSTIEKTPQSKLPDVISKITMNSIEEVDIIIQSALDIRSKTPYSFRILSNKLEIFNSDGLNQLKNAFEEYSPETMLSMPMFPSEIFYITYRKYIKCPDKSCSSTEEASLLFKKKVQCEHCDMEQYKRIQYILLDLRLITNGPIEDRASFLPMMIMVPQDDLKTDDFAELITNRFINDKERYHFILLTNKTDYFDEYDNTFYSENQSHLERMKNIFEPMTKKAKVIDLSLVEDLSKEELFKLKEYDNLKRSMMSFLKGNYPYISYIYGGFEAIHEESFRNINTPLLNHVNGKYCTLCKDKEIQKKLNASSFNKLKTMFSHTNNDEDNELVLNNTTMYVGYKDRMKITSASSLWERRKKIRLGELCQMMNNGEYDINNCFLYEFNNQNKKGLAIVVMLNRKEILIYQYENQLEVLSDNNISQNKKTNLNLVLLKYVELIDITLLQMKTSSKNIITLKYFNIENKTVNSMIIDFTSENIAKTFIENIKSYTTTM